MRRSVLFFVCFLSTGITAGGTQELVQLITYDGRSVNTSAPRFCWHPFDDTEEYGIEIADNPDFGCSFIEFVSDTCYTYDMELSDGAWYWRVSAEDHYLSDSRTDSVVVSTTSAIGTSTKTPPRRQVVSGRTWSVNGRRTSPNDYLGAQAVTVTIRAGRKEREVVGR